MSRSHPTVHPVEAPPLSIENAGAGDEPPRMNLKDVQGMPGTSGGLTLRLLQSLFAILSLAVMASTSDFPSVTAFRYLVATSILQILWSLSLAIMDVYALMVKRSFRNYKVVSLFTAGDGVRYKQNKVASSRMCFHWLKLLVEKHCGNDDLSLYEANLVISLPHLHLQQPVHLQASLS